MKNQPHGKLSGFGDHVSGGAVAASLTSRRRELMLAHLAARSHKVVDDYTAHRSAPDDHVGAYNRHSERQIVLPAMSKPGEKPRAIRALDKGNGRRNCPSTWWSR